jgi:putative DNA-invertase from lambdoid prophage Rac
MRSTIYCRVRANDQTNENRRIPLAEYSKEKGWDFEVHTEVESTQKKRPGKVELLNRLRDGEYGSVFICKLNQWMKSFTVLIAEISELGEKGIAFISDTENLDFSTSIDRPHFQILSAFAEFKRDLISERTKEDILGARNREKTHRHSIDSKDPKKRRKAGYYLRETRKKQIEDHKSDNYRPIEDYLNKSRP